MKKSILLLALALCCVSSFCQTYQTYTVDPNGTYPTLKHAYDAIDIPLTSSVIIYIKGAVKVQEGLDFSNPTTSYFQWTKSGTEQYSITIKPFDENEASINRDSNDSQKYGPMIYLKNVNYLNIEGVTFNDAFQAILGLNINHCVISHCKFIVNDLVVGGGNGAITITADDTTPVCGLMSADNQIIENYIQYTQDLVVSFINENKFQYFHGIYLGHAQNNTILYNTLVDVPGSAVQAWHGCTQGNVFKYNFTYRNNNHTGTVDGYRHGFILGDDIIPATVGDNEISFNYINASRWALSQHGGASKGPNINSLNIGSDMIDYSSSDIYSHNSFFYANDNGTYTPDPVRGYYAYDPLHMSDFDPTRYADKMVAGDFNGDGSKKEIAIFYDYGNATSGLRLFEASDQSSSNASDKQVFYYKGEKWWQDNFDISLVGSRVTSGDYDGDGKDDIAVFF